MAHRWPGAGTARDCRALPQGERGQRCGWPGSCPDRDLRRRPRPRHRRCANRRPDRCVRRHHRPEVESRKIMTTRITVNGLARAYTTGNDATSDLETRFIGRLWRRMVRTQYHALVEQLGVTVTFV